jgi:hypothetical protein
MTEEVKNRPLENVPINAKLNGLHFGWYTTKVVTGRELYKRSTLGD